jgi:hypothetical protein
MRQCVPIFVWKVASLKNYNPILIWRHEENNTNCRSVIYTISWAITRLTEC